MVKNKKRPSIKKKSWWYNLPHKAFLIFQICTSFFLYKLYGATITYDTQFLLPIVTLISTSIIFVIQFSLIAHYYGWRTCVTCILIIPLSAIFSLLSIFFLFAIMNILITILSINLFNIIKILDKYISYFILYLPFCAPIVPQYWRFKSHGRK